MGPLHCAPSFTGNIGRSCFVLISNCYAATGVEQFKMWRKRILTAMLGVPISAPNFVAQTEMGFRDFAHSLWSQQLKAFTRWRDLPDSRWPKLAMLEHLTSTEWHSKYFEYIVNIKNTISLPFVYSEEMIESHLSNFFLKKTQ